MEAPKSVEQGQTGLAKAAPKVKGHLGDPDR
jgi:hypothetical protein